MAQPNVTHHERTDLEATQSHTLTITRYNQPALTGLRTDRRRTLRSLSINKSRTRTANSAGHSGTNSNAESKTHVLMALGACGTQCNSIAGGLSQSTTEMFKVAKRSQ